MRNRIEIFRQVGVYNVGVAPADQPVRFLDRIARAAARAIAISGILEVRLEDRFQDELGGGLNHPIPDRRDAERAFAPSRLRDHHPPHRIGPVRLRNEFLAQARQPRFHALRVDLLESRSIDSRPSRIGAGERIGVEKNIFAADLVVEQIEAEGGLRLRLTIELPLKVSDLFGRFEAHRQSPHPHRLQKHTRSQGPFLRRSYPASTVVRPCPNSRTVRCHKQRRSRDLRPHGSPPITRITLPACRVHYPDGPDRCMCRLLPCPRGLPQTRDGSASASHLSRSHEAVVATGALAE